MVKINFGCGQEKLEGWINVDLDASYRPEVVADLSANMPFQTACAGLMYSEDFIVQLDLDSAYLFLRECHRVLKPGGIIRLLTPDLEKLTRAYLYEPEWLVATWKQFVGIPLKTQSACEVFNLGIRLAGQFHYDRKTLTGILNECGFHAKEVNYRQSEAPELRGLDLRRPDESISMYFDCYRF
ncbi:class I SAM-dependent methyltransferase [Nitrosococcus wardiae]|uniref:Methyltransferase domain-containing protein n=1 Tax=Nitrosococcus wardiae TaxID=1814290 RepID=A0A4P7BYL7_9GAMM|nr:methyltransferase domain-containing protein [Nitrosococcus wardiae]QBQ53516.1 methyltransferase domain-containing protein [Nitrosococcus wardiae]